MMIFLSYLILSYHISTDDEVSVGLPFWYSLVIQFSCLVICSFSDSVQSYSFVLTTDDSKWRFGFCRHDPKTDTTMVIITLLPWHDTFLRFLITLAELRRLDDADFRQFLTEAYNGGVPDVGGQLKFSYNHGLNVNWIIIKI